MNVIVCWFDMIVWMLGVVCSK